MLLMMMSSEYVMKLGEGHAHVVPVTVFVAVLCLCLVIGHFLRENRWVNESITAILIGCLAGTIILFISKGKSSHILRFDEEVFFIYLLPPIIFNAGFQVKKKQFFHNFFTIMLFGVVGVFISTTIISAGSMWLFPKFGFVGLTTRDYLGLSLSLEYFHIIFLTPLKPLVMTLACTGTLSSLCSRCTCYLCALIYFLNSGIGTIFSSTDTVCTLQVLHQDETPLLYSLVFGEGVVNDATSVVLFNTVQKLDVNRLHGRQAVHILWDFLYLFSTSTALGVSAGLLTAYILKGLYFGRHCTVREIALMVLMAYLSYMLAELLNLSGILTVFFCGIFMSHYAWHNTTESSKITTRHVFATMSFIAETFIFLYVGMDALDIEKWRLSKLRVWTLLVICTILIFLILLGRAAFVFPVSVLSNYANRNASRSSTVTFKHQVIIWWAGLMRGAVSIALAFKEFTHSGVTWDPVNATMVTTTVIVVLFSTIVFGFLTKPLVSCLLPPHDANIGDLSREPTISKEDMRLPLLSFEESAATNVLRAKDSLSMLLERPVHTIHHYWRRFDDAYMRPIFGGLRSNNSSS